MERPPVAAVAPPLPRRSLSNEERHEIMRDGILAVHRMKPYGDTAARLCQLHMEAGNSLATASRLIVGNTLLVTGWICARSGGCRLLLLLLLAAAAACRCCCCCCLLLLLLLLLLLAAAAVAGRRSAWATAVPMLVQQRTYAR